MVSENHIFCVTCARAIKPIVSLILPVTKHQVMSVLAVSSYQNPMRALVLKKFYGDLTASRQLAHLILEHTPIKTLSIDYLVPVPLHWTRYASRGFNQAYEMSTVIGKTVHVPVLRLVSRHRRTTFQWKLAAETRRENVKHAFVVHPWYRFVGMPAIEGKNIVIVDDLCTTGATLMQVAKVIARYKPASLTAIVACRAT